MEAEKRLRKKLTIDSSNQKFIEKEKRFWRDVLKRIISVVKTLSSSNLTFRGSNDEKLDDHNSGNFLSIIRMIADFDPIMEEHLRRIRRKEIRRVHYLGHNVQNELILLLAGEIRNKIIEIIKGAKYFSVILDFSDAGSLENYELQSFEFLLGIVIWFEVLQKVNKISKILQRKDMVISEGISLLKGLIIFLEEYINFGFENAKSEVEKIALEMEIVDHALSSLKTRFEQFQKYEEIFGFLFDLNKLKEDDDESLNNSCATLEKFLKHEDAYDISGLELFSELQLLRKALPDLITKPHEVLEYVKNFHHGFPNAWIAYRILLIIPVTVASAERSFSKLKLIKNYLRSTMSQDRLNGLAILSIEKNMVANLDYDDLVDNFAQQKARRI
ncbi:uncharacterized protein [Henckelia pumila]|uniref:uncharacterized protein n=1 Tax=Henckelia pumila TaxID=405737 RepID=UPI003C6DC292